MAEATQYTVSNRELVEIIIRHAGVHEGKWVLMANMGFSGGNFGPSPDKMGPGAVVAVQNMGIARAESGAPPEMLVDAAVVNPSPKTK